MVSGFGRSIPDNDIVKACAMTTSLKSHSLAFAVGSIVVGALTVAFLWQLSDTLREKAMLGPYQGLEWAGLLPASAADTLRVDDRFVLQLFENPLSDGPILVLSSRDNRMPWQRLLVPFTVDPSGKTNHAKVSNMRFRGCQKTRSGYKIAVVCTWEWGGTEKGIVYLANDLSFGGFALGW